MKERPHRGNKAMRRSLSMHYKDVNSLRCRTTLLPTEFIFATLSNLWAMILSLAALISCHSTGSAAIAWIHSHMRTENPWFAVGNAKSLTGRYWYIRVCMYNIIYIYGGGWQPPSNLHAAQQSNAIYMIPLCRVHYLYTPPSHRVPGRGVSYTLHTLYCIHNLLLPIQ